MSFEEWLVIAVSAGLAFSAASWFLYTQLTSDDLLNVGDKCWFSISLDNGTSAFSVPLRNVSTDVFAGTDCNILKNKCLYTAPNSTNHYWFERCEWSEKDKECVCMIRGFAPS